MTRILIVDDEEMGRTVMEEMASSYGQSVSVSNGKDAVRVFESGLEKNKPFDLVLLDISLEDINGLEVLKQMKAIEKEKQKANDNKKAGEKNTVVVMVTAHSEKEMVIDCIRAGCKAYFIKPLKQDDVDKKFSELGFEKHFFKFTAPDFEE
jgi:two-component system chemotaxis response regulator CheY